MDFYVVLRAADAKRCVEDGEVAVWYAGRNDYIGLCETEAGAVDRAKFVFGTGKVTRETHCMMRFTFTVEGIAYYMINNAGEAANYAPLLHKQIFWGATDHGTWHFHGSLPLQKNAKRPLDGVRVHLVTGTMQSLPPL